MAVSFGSARVSTAGERNIYDQMIRLRLNSEVKARDDSFAIQTSRNPIYLENDPKKFLRCVAMYFPQERIVSCYYRDLWNFDADGRITFWKEPGTLKVAEIRYGDIDKDGDVDIAVKLTNGAIYVFHNLSK